MFLYAKAHSTALTIMISIDILHMKGNGNGNKINFYTSPRNKKQNSIALDERIKTLIFTFYHTSFLTLFFSEFDATDPQERCPFEEGAENLS